MKQIIEYIRSYSKALLRKIGCRCGATSSETVRRGGRSLRTNVGCRQNFGTTHSEAI